MKRDVLGLRVSPELRALIETYGNRSAASAALMLIGAAALGADLGELQVDLLRLYFSDDLTPAIRARLRTLFNIPLTQCLTFPGGAPAAIEALEIDDPFAVGIEV